MSMDQLMQDRGRSRTWGTITIIRKNASLKDDRIAAYRGCIGTVILGARLTEDPESFIIQIVKHLAAQRLANTGQAAKRLPHYIACRPLDRCYTERDWLTLPTLASIRVARVIHKNFRVHKDAIIA